MENKIDLHFSPSSQQIVTGPEAKQQSAKTRGSVCYRGRGDQRIEQGV